MMRRVALIGLGLSCLLWAESLDFPSGGVLKFERSKGDLRIEGWDRPTVEIEPTAATERHGDELAVTANTDLARHVYVPRSARLVIDRHSGEVLIEGVKGDIHATVGQGAIGLFLPQETPNDIDARTKLGSVSSDFAAKAPSWRWFFRHQLMQPADTGARKLYLRVGFGDISILKQPAR